VGYGKAEGLLEKKWPSKHNELGHWHWGGRIYGPGLNRINLLQRSKIFFGKWGNAPFQSIYEPAPGTLLSYSMMPEWYLLILILFGFSVLGISWEPLLLAFPLLITAIALLLTKAMMNARKASYSTKPHTRIEQLKIFSLTTFLNLLQPLARLWGRMQTDLTLWRRPPMDYFRIPRIVHSRIWSEHWKAPDMRLEAIEKRLRKRSVAVLRGGDYDRWDLEVRGGLFGTARTCMAVEDHGSGTQLVRFRSWPRVGAIVMSLTCIFAILSILSAIDRAWMASIVLGILTIIILVRIVWDSSAAIASLTAAIEQPETK
jgi:hypothetical protein